MIAWRWRGLKERTTSSSRRLYADVLSGAFRRGKPRALDALAYDGESARFSLLGTGTI